MKLNIDTDPNTLKGYSTLTMHVRPGFYRAILVVKHRYGGTQHVNELQHYLIVTDEGKVYEPCYFSHIVPGQTTIHHFPKMREWDAKLLKDYCLYSVESTPLPNDRKVA